MTDDEQDVRYCEGCSVALPPSDRWLDWCQECIPGEVV